jgi:acyl-CoA thioester hydrolase
MQSKESRETAIEITVRSTDMDADRVVNNAVYFHYFEQSRLEHLLRWGVIDWPPGPASGTPQFALVQTAAQFRAPAVHRDRLTVATRTVAVSARTFTLSYTVRRSADGLLICEGSSIQVWLDGDGRASDIPEGPRSALTGSIHESIGNPDVR